MLTEFKMEISYCLLLFMISFVPLTVYLLLTKGTVVQELMILYSYAPLISLILLYLIKPDIELKEEELGLTIGDAKYLLIALLYPIALTYTTASIALILGFNVTLNAPKLGMNAPITVDSQVYLAVILISILLIAPLVNILITIGEEIGFRGFIFSRLTSVVNPLSLLLIPSILWAVWKMPFLLFNSRFNNMISLVVWCTIIFGYLTEFSIFLIWLRARSESVMVTALASSSLSMNIYVGQYISGINIVYGTPISLLGIAVQTAILLLFSKKIIVEVEQIQEKRTISRGLKEVLSTPQPTD